MTSGKKIKIKLIRSTIKHHRKIKETVKALGLRKINQVKIHNDTPQIRGMINKVRFLLEIEEIANTENENIK